MASICLGLNVLSSYPLVIDEMVKPYGGRVAKYVA